MTALRACFEANTSIPEYSLKIRRFCLIQIANAQFVVLEPPVLDSNPSNTSNTQLLTKYNGTRCFVTVINTGNESLVTPEWLATKIQSLRMTDDVFQDEFLHGVIFTSTHELGISEGAKSLLISMGTVWIEKLTTPLAGGDLPNPGVYLASNQVLHEIRRLYDDSHGCFLASLIRSRTNEYSELGVSGNSIHATSIAVPSRLQQTPSPRRPLAGLRIAVKDIFQIKGVRMSVCNKAFYDLYPPPPATASCISLLENMGAVIVGTTKLASFAATEEPVECVDFQAPWNPRGDGYISPAGSSSGSGAAIASYPWLDVSIGSDTSGSGRRPGHWNGCFAMRPTHGVLPVDGYIPSFRRFDVPTFFARDIEICKKFATAWYGEKLKTQSSSELPNAIIYSEDYFSMIQNKKQLDVVHNFLGVLEGSQQVLHQKVSFERLWEVSPPEESAGQSLQEFMADVCRNSFFYDDYHSFDQFRNDYKEKFGKTPYVSPPVRWQWELSSHILKSERDDAVAKLDVYKKWFSRNVMQSGKYNTIVLIPIEELSARYRDEPSAKYFNPVGVPNLFLSPITGGPEFTVPIGQVPYLSKVSGREEHLPVGISLLGEPGTDIALIAAVQKCLEMSGRPTVVQTGREMFPDNSV